MRAALFKVCPLLEAAESLDNGGQKASPMLEPWTLLIDLEICVPIIRWELMHNGGTTDIVERAIHSIRWRAWNAVNARNRRVKPSEVGRHCVRLLFLGRFSFSNQTH